MHWNNNFNRKYWEIIGSKLPGPQGDKDYRRTKVLQPFKSANILFYFPAKQAQKNEVIQAQGSTVPKTHIPQCHAI